MYASHRRNVNTISKIKDASGNMVNSLKEIYNLNSSGTFSEEELKVVKECELECDYLLSEIKMQGHLDLRRG